VQYIVSPPCTTAAHRPLVRPASQLLPPANSSSSLTANYLFFCLKRSGRAGLGLTPHSFTTARTITTVSRPDRHCQRTVSIETFGGKASFLISSLSTLIHLDQHYGPSLTTPSRHYYDHSTLCSVSRFPLHNMHFSLFHFLSLASLLSLVAAQQCSSSQSCPATAPCCSEYGYCGSGSYCLGGCEPLCELPPTYLL